MAFTCTILAVPSLQRDDEVARVTRWDFPPGAVTGWHSHGWPYFVVMLTNSLMRVHDGTKVIEISRLAGESYERPAGVEHDVMNGGDTPMVFVEIELKQAFR